jgi:hypothetical protein
LLALEELHREFDTDILLIESGGDNLAANYSRELADFIIYVVRPAINSIMSDACAGTNRGDDGVWLPTVKMIGSYLPLGKREKDKSAHGVDI